MQLLAEVQTAHFWLGLLTIIWVNTILSGDNAVVIALAARSLPKHQQGKAVFWGAGVAVILRIVLTLVTVELLKLSWLKIAGGIALLYIAAKLLVPEDADSDLEGSDNLMRAIWTILVADLVMSTDNVLGVAAAAKGSTLLLILGLAISIPLVIFGATILMKLMQRFPIIIAAGAAILGWVAGDLIVTDPALAPFEHILGWMNIITLPAGLGEINLAQIAGAVFAIVAGKMLAARSKKEDDGLPVDLAPTEQRGKQ